MSKKKKDNKISEIIPDELYLGSAGARRVEYIEKYGWKVIISICTHNRKKLDENISYHHFHLEDKEDEIIEDLFPKIYDIIEEARELKKVPIFLHCTAGVSRSVTACVAYLMRKNNWSADKALEFVKERRVQARPNVGFKRKLKEFEEKISVTE